MRKSRIRMTTEILVERATQKYCGKFDYSKSKFIDWVKPILIICPFHGLLETSPKHHLYRNKHGCKQCGQEAWEDKKNLQTKLAFFDKVKDIHGDKYDLSNTGYKTTREKVEVICGKHGSFLISPNHLLSGKGCKKCGVESSSLKRSTGTEKFISKAKTVHGNSYEYSMVQYVSSGKLITIICPFHGEFTQLPTNHLKGHGCLDCGFLKTGDGLRKAAEQFISETKSIHGDKYDYSRTVYVNTRTNIEIICTIHGPFMQTPLSHLKGCGCMLCADILNSSGVRRIERWLIANEIKYEREKTFTNFRSKKKRRQHLRFDFFISEIAVLIEYDGQQHFRAIDHWGGEQAYRATIENDKIKEDWAKNNGFRILRISFMETKLTEKILSEHLLGYLDKQT